MPVRFDRRTLLQAGAAGAVAVVVDAFVDLGGPPDHRVWSRIEAWMDAHAPAARDVLRPGADEDLIEAAEGALKLALPESFRRSLRRHDGQDERGPSLVEFGYLMSLERIVRETRGLAEWFDTARPGTDPWWRPGLLPFVARDGDYLCLDLDPPKGGRHGAVWALLHDDEPALSRVAAGYGPWLTRWADELEAGVFVLDEAPGTGLLPRDGGPGSRLWPR